MKVVLLALCVSVIIEVLLVLQSALAVKTCYFCADEKKICKTNDKSIQPVRMTCEDFLVNQMPMKDYFRKPNLFKDKPTVLFRVGLPAKNVKTLCMSIVYKFKGGRGIWNKTSTNVTHYPDKETYVLQSCMYQKLAEYNNACHFYQSHLFEKHEIKTLSCSLCKKHDCNEAVMISPSESLLVVFFILINFLAM